MAGRLAGNPLPVMAAREETKEADSGSLAGVGSLNFNQH